jgi:hypothetical protein
MIVAAARSARPEARRLLLRVSPLVRFEVNRGACAAASASCVRAAEPGVARPIVISISAAQLGRARTPAARAVRRFVILHELAHAVDAALLTPAGRAAFAAALRGAARAPCRPRAASGTPCAPAHELFADELARFAGGFDVSLTTYDTPPLLTAGQVSALVARSVGPQLERRLFGHWPGE